MSVVNNTTEIFDTSVESSAHSNETRHVHLDPVFLFFQYVICRIRPLLWYHSVFV